MNKVLPISLFLLALSWMPASIHHFRRQGALPGLQRSALVDRFYRERNQQLFWFVPGEGATKGRNQLLACIDSAAWQGLDSNRYHPAQLRALLSAGIAEGP